MTTSPPELYEIVGGIIAIPIAMIGAAYTVSLIKKTRLESKKLELEILKTESEAKKVRESLDESQEIEAASHIKSTAFQFVVLKFIVLYLLLKSWELIENAFQFLAGGAYLGLTRLEIIDTENNIALGLFFIISNAPQAVYWVILIGLGLSIFRDANQILGFELKDFFKWNK